MVTIQFGHTRESVYTDAKDICTPATVKTCTIITKENKARIYAALMAIDKFRDV